MATTEKLLLGTTTQLITTGLNSLANNAQVLSGAYDNTQGGAGDGAVLAEFELFIASMGGAATANTALTLWAVQSLDGTNYEDGDASTTPAKLPLCVFPVRAVSTAQRITRVSIPLPPGLSKYLLRNDGTGQALASSGNILSIRPYSRQAV